MAHLEASEIVFPLFGADESFEWLGFYRSMFYFKVRNEAYRIQVD